MLAGFISQWIYWILFL